MALFCLRSHLLGARRGSDPDRVRAQLPALWTDSVWFWSLAIASRSTFPVPVRVLWQDVARIYFGSLMSLRANAPRSPTRYDGYKSRCALQV